MSKSLFKGKAAVTNIEMEVKIDDSFEERSQPKNFSQFNHLADLHFGLSRGREEMNGVH